MNLDEFKLTLELKLSELERLGRNAAERIAVVELDQASVGRLSRIDALQRQAISIESERRRTLEIQKIKAALKRIQDEEFGACLSCGQDISLPRLKLDPATPLCIKCAR